jgi:DNA-directed RNA polymerase subunit alpha
LKSLKGKRVSVTIYGQEEFRAGDLSGFLNGFLVLNPDLLICRMEPDTKLAD